MSMTMNELLKALPTDVDSSSKVDKISDLLESAESAWANKQTERASDYCTQALELVESYLPAHTQASIMELLDGSTAKVEQFVEAGDKAEDALNVLVMLSQLLLLRGETSMEKAQLEASRTDFARASHICLKISDEIAAARCKRSEGMLLLMKKDIKGAEEALEEAILLSRSGADAKEEMLTVKLLTQLHEGRAQKFDHCCELLHQTLESLHAEGDEEALNSTLLLLGQFRLRRHLADTESGAEVQFADLEMTDLDIQGAVTYLQTKLEEEGGGEGEGGEDLKCRTAEALLARGTIKMLLGDQPPAEEALKRACKLYEEIGDDDGEQRAAALLSDVTRIMDKVDSTAVTPIS